MNPKLNGAKEHGYQSKFPHMRDYNKGQSTVLAARTTCLLVVMSSS